MYLYKYKPGTIALTGSNAYRFITKEPFSGDLDFVVLCEDMLKDVNTNNGINKIEKHNGINKIIKTHSYIQDEIKIDISTCDGKDFTEDYKSRSCETCFIIRKGSDLIPLFYTKKQIIPDNANPEIFIMNMIKFKGSDKTMKFWHKKLSNGYCWGKLFKPIHC